MSLRKDPARDGRAGRLPKEPQFLTDARRHLPENFRKKGSEPHEDERDAHDEHPRGDMRRHVPRENAVLIGNVVAVTRRGTVPPERRLSAVREGASEVFLREHRNGHSEHHGDRSRVAPPERPRMGSNRHDSQRDRAPKNRTENEHNIEHEHLKGTKISIAKKERFVKKKEMVLCEYLQRNASTCKEKRLTK